MDLELLKEKRAFTTKDATRRGWTKAQLRLLPEILELGTFPVRNPNGTSSLQSVWTYDPELVEKVKSARREAKRINRNEAKLNELLDEISATVRTIFGYDKEESDANQANQANQTQINASEEVNHEIQTTVNAY